MVIPKTPPKHMEWQSVSIRQKGHKNSGHPLKLQKTVPVKKSILEHVTILVRSRARTVVSIFSSTQETATALREQTETRTQSETDGPNKNARLAADITTNFKINCTHFN